jgi:hypothetical protein
MVSELVGRAIVEAEAAASSWRHGKAAVPPRGHQGGA